LHKQLNWNILNAGVVSPGGRLETGAETSNKMRKGKKSVLKVYLTIKAILFVMQFLLFMKKNKGGCKNNPRSSFLFT